MSKQLIGSMKKMIKVSYNHAAWLIIPPLGIFSKTVIFAIKWNYYNYTDYIAL